MQKLTAKGLLRFIVALAMILLRLNGYSVMDAKILIDRIKREELR